MSTSPDPRVTIIDAWGDAMYNGNGYMAKGVGTPEEALARIDAADPLRRALIDKPRSNELSLKLGDVVRDAHLFGPGNIVHRLLDALADEFGVAQ